jgi:hypothetical protein
MIAGAAVTPGIAEASLSREVSCGAERGSLALVVDHSAVDDVAEVSREDAHGFLLASARIKAPVMHGRESLADYVELPLFGANRIEPHTRGRDSSRESSRIVQWLWFAAAATMDVRRLNGARIVGRRSGRREGSR